MARGARLLKTRIDSTALLVSRHGVGDADQILRLFTEDAGMIAVIARNALRSRRRFAGLEPLHLLQVQLEVSPARELGTLLEARIERPRMGIAASLEAIEGAGQALRWLRRAAPARAPEPELWHEVNGLLDRLDALPLGAPVAAVRPLVASAGLRLLSASGWGLELGRCVRCFKACPERARVEVDVAAGGVVCRTCIGVDRARTIGLSSRQRRGMMAVWEEDAEALAELEDADVAIALVERALEVHGLGEAT